MLIETLSKVMNTDCSDRRFDARQWVAFCRWLDAHGILACLEHELNEKLPAPIMRYFKNIDATHRSTACNRMKSFASVASLAQSEHLKYAIIKGMASSKQLYGDEYVRQSGDIDILVQSDDIPKVDYVLRKAGWMQPAEAFRVRMAINSGKPFSNVFIEEESSYTFRSNPFLPHFSNYYRLNPSLQ